MSQYYIVQILAQAIQQDLGSNEDSFAYNSARLWTLSLKQAGLEHIINKYADNDDSIRENKQVYLETGDAKSGLEHIWLRHQNDFRNLANVNNEKELQNFIYKLMSIGQYSAYSYRKIPAEKGGGFQVIYEADGGVYLSVIIARNGYIVTATIANDETKKGLYNGPTFKDDFSG